MDALREAYVEATSSTARPRRLDKDFVRRIVAAIPEGRWLSYSDIAEVASGSRAGAVAVGAFLSTDPDLIGTAVHRVLSSEGKVSGGFRGAVGGPAEARAQLEREGIEFDGQGRASRSRRIQVGDILAGD